jgi:dihydrofolate reductase
MNESQKYVASATLESSDWSTSTILGPYDAEKIRGLEERTSGNLYVSGSARLVRQLLADRVLNELHLFVPPVTLGSDERLFAEGNEDAKFGLMETEGYDGSVADSAYRAAL